MPLLAGSIGSVGPSKARRHALMLLCIAGLSCAAELAHEHLPLLSHMQVTVGSLLRVF